MSKTNAAKIISDLKEGNLRFLNGQSLQTSTSSLAKLKKYAEKGQFPKAIVLCCSDSRAPVEYIFDQDIGDLFVIRVAGNIVAPSLIGSIEFAASLFKTSLVLVMGHSGCGAVTATLANIMDTHVPSSENIHDIVSRIKPHVYSIAHMDQLSESEKLDMAIEANVRASVGQIESSSRMIEELVRNETLMVVGAVLDLSTGQVAFLES